MIQKNTTYGYVICFQTETSTCENYLGDYDKISNDLIEAKFYPNYEDAKAELNYILKRYDHTSNELFNDKDHFTIKMVAITLLF